MSDTSSSPASCTDMLVNVKFSNDGRLIAPQQRSVSVSTQGSDCSFLSRESSTDSFHLCDPECEKALPKRRYLCGRELKAVIIFFSGLNGVLIIVLSVLVYIITSSQEKAQFCLPCSKVTLTSEEENELLADVDRKTKNGQQMCCAKDDAMVALLINYVSAFHWLHSPGFTNFSNCII